MAKQTPVYNTAGTHVFVVFSNGQEWECPVETLDYFLSRGAELTTPRDKSWDGLFDESTAEGASQTGFDPAKHKVGEVNDHLADHLASPGEIVRVLELEAAGQNRPGIKDPRLTEPADSTTGD